MPVSTLKTLLKDYRTTSNSFEKSSLIQMIVKEIFKHGFTHNSIDFFSRQYDLKAKQELIREIFKELDFADKFNKLEIIDTLSSFLVETTHLIQDQILPVYIENLANKKDFSLVFTTLKIFMVKWDEFSDKIKKQLFNEFLVILENPVDIFIEEGIFEITNIILNSRSSLDPSQKLFSEKKIKDYLTKLIELSLKKKGDSLYASLESIQKILSTYPGLILKEIYEQIFPLFKKISRKIAIFYPAKRRYVKLGLSFLNLILLFEQFSDEDYIDYLTKIIDKITSKIDHADVKYFLEVIAHILKNTHTLPKKEVIKPSFKILRNLNQKKRRLSSYIVNLVDEIINGIWPLLDDKEKDFFFEEIDRNDSIL